MVKSGDIFSIEVASGRGYFQFVCKNELMGSLIRVFPGVRIAPPADFAAFVEQETNFWTFFPVAKSLKQGLIRKEANCSIPVHAQAMPLFRAGVVDPATKRVETWWLWDGEKTWQIGALGEEQRRLPIRGNWNDTLLKERIEQGWLPERDSR